MNTLAQLVEVVHCIEEAIVKITGLLEQGVRSEKPNQDPTRYGRGIAATEVPRGILFHDYTYNRQGGIEAANCIIPTGQNLANILHPKKSTSKLTGDRPVTASPR